MQLRHSFPSISAIPSLEYIKDVIAENYKNYDPETECSRKTLKQRWKNGDIDPSWKHCSHLSEHSGKEIHQFRSDTQRAWNGIELRFSLGLYAVPMAYERAVKTLNDIGFNVVLSTIGMMDKYDVGVPKGFPLDIHDFYSNRDLEIDRGHDHEDKDIIALTHSTSGTGSLKNGAEPSKVAQYLNRGIIGAVDLAPFCGMAYANKDFYRLARMTLGFQAMVNPHAKPSETLGGKAHHIYMKSSGEPQIFSAIEDPTFAQMMEMEVLTEDTMETLRKIAPDQLQLPRVIIVPEKDSVACAKMGIVASQNIKSSLHRTNAWHSSFIEYPHRSIMRTIMAVRKFQDLKQERALNIAQAALASPMSAPHAT